MPGTKPPRIIAGSAKGKKLITTPGFTIRPLLSRIKKSLFDILRPEIDNSVFLDLYAGTGNVGIEALSRGAKKAVFVENSRQCVEMIEKNLINCGFSKKAEVLSADITTKLPKFNRKFDIIFIGPPYKLNLTTKTIEIIDENNLLSNNGWIIAQHHIKEPVAEEIGKFIMLRQKKYGDTMLTFFKKRGKN